MERIQKTLCCQKQILKQMRCLVIEGTCKRCFRDRILEENVDLNDDDPTVRISRLVPSPMCISLPAYVILLIKLLGSRVR